MSAPAVSAPALGLPLALALALALVLSVGCCDAALAKARKAPSGPPLVSGEEAYASQGEVEVEGGSDRQSPLVGNGLGSPLCETPGALSAKAAGDCRTSGFVAAAAPTQNYGIDVNIDTGALSFQSDASSVIQDFGVKLPWNVAVWAVHALLVALEWSYTVDLLHGSAMGTVGTALHEAQRAFTDPWIASVLAVAGVLIAYRGIVRRQVADTLGEALAILALMAGGLWMIADPVGTVGAVAKWSDSASMQTLGAVSSGTTAHPRRALADTMGQLFRATIRAPWCYLEFGNVAWCEDPSRLDRRLRAVALRIAANERAKAEAGGGPSAEAHLRSATLLRSAGSNGALFLALPPNGSQRNASTESGTLLSAICHGSNATHCHGATAPEAEFRTAHGTLDRLAGLALICAGLLGMVLLLGFVVMRLLGAALLGLLLLLSAPALVLAPALGENGRAVFRSWAGRLFAAVASKLIWSFLLGAVLVTMKVVLVLHGFGWWVQWLLLSVLWWGGYLNRHRLLAGSERAAGGRARGGGAIHRLERAVEPGRAAGRWMRRRRQDHRDRERARRREREQERRKSERPPVERRRRRRPKGEDGESQDTSGRGKPKDRSEVGDGDRPEAGDRDRPDPGSQQTRERPPDDRRDRHDGADERSRDEGGPGDGAGDRADGDRPGADGDRLHAERDGGGEDDGGGSADAGRERGDGNARTDRGGPRRDGGGGPRGDDGGGSRGDGGGGSRGDGGGGSRGDGPADRPVESQAQAQARFQELVERLRRGREQLEAQEQRREEQDPLRRRRRQLDEEEPS